MNAQDGKAEAWLASFTKQLRCVRPGLCLSCMLTRLSESSFLKGSTSSPMPVRCVVFLSECILTSKPAVAPWFSAGLYKTGAYSAVNAAVGSLIDWV
jgi:hypothetical protein